MKKKKTSPLKINQALIENYKGVNKYTRTGGGTRIPEMGVEGVDAMFKPMARTAAVGLTKSYLGGEEKEEENKQENTDPNTIKSLEAQIAKLQQQQRQQDNNETPAEETPTEDTQEGNEEVETKTPPSKEEKKMIADEVEEEFNQYPEDVQSGLTLEQERLAGEAEPSKIKVRRVMKKGKPNTNMVEVNGQEMSVSDFYESFPEYESMRKGNFGKSSGTRGYEGNPIGNYEFQGSLTQGLGNDSSPVKMLDNSDKTYDPLTDLQMQNPNIERDVDTYIDNTSLVGDEKLDVLGAQANSRVYDYAKQLKDQAAMYVDQEGSSKIVNDSINTLRGLTQKVNNLIEKKSEWIENNGGGESGRRSFSKGSSGKNKFMQNAIFSERDDLYKMILPLPETTVGGDTKFDDVEFAFGDFKNPNKPNAVVKSSQIFKDVFMKPEGKFADFRKAAVKQNENSRNRKPFNAYHAEVVVNGLLDSKENILAFAWDDFAGPSFIDQYAEASPEEDLGWTDVDNPSFDENRLKKEVSFWLKRKLQAEHSMAKATDEAFAEAGQMTAKQLLKKYSIS